ncbi:MAG: FtsX-like permease family protein, partial [Acidobacteria bacterium]|nr:FtsX-like permease family protein [Acidobacteriota bacterium]
VIQRWKQIAILRAIGVEVRNVVLMLLGEALVLGVIGSIVGLGAGMLMATFALKLVLGATQTVYGFVASTPTLSFSVAGAALTIGLGVVASAIGAWFPTRNAAKMQTALALHDVEVRSAAAKGPTIQLSLGLALIAAFWLIVLFVPARPDSYVQMAYAALMMLGMVLVLPMLLEVGARILRPVASSVFGVEGAIAIDNVARAPKRTVATVAAIMLGLMFALSTASFIASQKNAVNRSVDKAAAADLLVTSSSELHSRSFHFSTDTADRLAALPGVAAADKVRISSTTIDGRLLTIMAHEMRSYFQISPDLLDAGDPKTAADATSRQEGVLISNNMAYRWGLHLGDKLTLRSPSGELSLPIVGMLDYYRSENGTIFIDRSLYEQYWQDSDVDYVLLKLQPGRDENAFKANVESALVGSPRAFIYTHDEYKAWVGQIVDQFFMMMYMQMIVAVIVAVIGLINTMMISVAHRRRELGVFRAIGGLRRQIIKMVVIEATAIAAIGLVAGMIAGVMNSYFLVKNAAKVAAGFNLPLVLPYAGILWSIPVVVIIAILAGSWPARSAARMNVVEAIGYE